MQSLCVILLKAQRYATQVADPVIINAGDGAHAHPSQGFPGYVHSA